MIRQSESHFQRFTKSVRRLGVDRVFIAAYAVLLLVAALIVPLRIPEILQLATSRHSESFGLARWIAQAPGSAPLNYFVQLPFVWIFRYSRFGARLGSLLFALGSSYLFLRLAKRIPLVHPYLALVVFMLLPVHFQVAAAGLPFEQALFLLLLATEWFFRLVERPAVQTSAIYAALLTLCLYTDRYAYTAAFGYLLFLFRFVNRPRERRAVWFALPSTVLPMLLFLPYYLWARASPYWLTAPPTAAGSSTYLHNFLRFAGEVWAGFILAPLLVAGTIAGVWTLFGPVSGAISKRIVSFCLLGGIVSTLVAAFVADFWLGDSFSPNQILWAMPATVILVFEGLESLLKQRYMKIAAAALAGLLILLSVAGDYGYLSDRSEDQQTLSGLVLPELKEDSCVVFVSQKLSKTLFTVFHPELEQSECVNFFHRRIVLASHPYVRSVQQRDAESFFRALNFTERKRIRAGGGQIVTMDLMTTDQGK